MATLPGTLPQPKLRAEPLPRPGPMAVGVAPPVVSRAYKRPNAGVEWPGETGSVESRDSEGQLSWRMA